MGISAAMNVGLTALNAAQTALEMVGNNIANANTPGYSRENAVLAAAPAQSTGYKLGTGVQVQGIQRVYSAAVNAQLWAATSDAQSAKVQNQNLSQIESLYGDTSSTDLTTTMTKIFNAFSALAGEPTNAGQQTIVVSQAQALAGTIVQIRTGLDQVRQQADTAARTDVAQINQLASTVAGLNTQIMETEQGQTGSAPGLEDERDSAIASLSQLIGIRTVTQNDGSVNVIVGNSVLVDGSTARSLTTQTVNNNGLGVAQVEFADNNEPLTITGGDLGGQMATRDQWCTGQIASLDTLTQGLISAVNALTAGGVGATPQTSLTGSAAALDPTAALDTAQAGLNFTPQNGSFLVNVTNNATGQTTPQQINVVLNGGPGDDTLQSLAAKLNAVPNVQSYVDSTNHLVVKGANSGVSISFSDDTSNVLPALGLGGLFTGYDSETIGVSPATSANPGTLATSAIGASSNGAVARQIANLASTSLSSLGNVSLLGYQQQAATTLAVNAQNAKSSSDAASAFLSSATNDQQAISGVNLDEEAVNMIQYQNGYAAAAKFIATMQQVMQQLLQM
jgi:flagellar hook-associated protein 1 FlgK